MPGTVGTFRLFGSALWGEQQIIAKTRSQDGLYRQTPDGTRSLMLLGALVKRGKAAEIYAIESDGSGDEDDRIAKIYLTPAIAAENADKLAAMLATAPDLPAVEKDGAAFPLIAWPDALIVDEGGSVCGYTMPRIDERAMMPLITLIDPQSTANRSLVEAPADFNRHGFIAYNLAHDMAALHRCGHQFNRLDWNKIRFHPELATLAVLATDTMAITGPDGAHYAGVPPMPGAIAPEFAGKTGPDFPHAQDEFALAKAISQLLRRGIHPSNQMPDATRALFDRAFAAPVNGVCERPPASEWAAHLATLLTEVITPCDANPMHLHYGEGCGACVAEAKDAEARAKAEVEAEAKKVAAAAKAAAEAEAERAAAERAEAKKAADAEAAAKAAAMAEAEAGLATMLAEAKAVNADIAQTGKVTRANLDAIDAKADARITGKDTESPPSSPYAGAFEPVHPARADMAKRGTPGWLIALMIGVMIAGFSFTAWQEMSALDAGYTATDASADAAADATADAAVDAAVDATADAGAAEGEMLAEPTVIISPNTPRIFVPFAQAETRYAAPGGTVGYINLRSTTDHLSTSNIITTIPLGEAVTATGRQIDGEGRVWVRVTYNGQSGFVSERVLSSSPPDYTTIQEQRM